MRKRVWKLLKNNKLFAIYFSLFGIFFARVWSIALFLDEHGLRSGWIASWADGAAHLSYMSAFAYRSSFPITHPLYLGKVFSYPFVVDMIGGYLVKMGLPLWTAYNWLGFLLTMFFVVMVWKLYMHIFSDSKIAFIGGLIFFLAGGLSELPKIFPHLSVKLFNTYDVAHIISAQIMPQRALLLGMPLSIFILITLFSFFEKKTSWNKMLGVGILAGFLPIIHSHSLMIVGLMSVWLFGIDVWRHKKIRCGWWWYGVPATLIGVFFVLRQVGSFDGSFVRLQLGWLAASKNESWVWFWIKLWSIWPLMSWLGFSQLKWQKKIYFYPLILLFMLVNIYVFQPYDWDNTKLITWVYLFFSGTAGLGLVRLYKKNRLVSVLIFMTLIFSGVIHSMPLLSPQSDPNLYLFTHDDLGLARKIRQNTPDNAVFLTNSYHASIIPVLTGRQILMGYPGWLWTYGIDYLDRKEDVESMYLGGEDFYSLASKYGVDYAVVDPITISQGVDEGFFENNFSKIFENKTQKIYKLRDN